MCRLPTSLLSALCLFSQRKRIQFKLIYLIYFIYPPRKTNSQPKFRYSSQHVGFEREDYREAEGIGGL